jgi:glutamyl-tRNA synthetase
MKDIAMPLRLGITGMKVSPGVFEVAEQLGRDEVRKRLAYYNFVE